MLFSEKGARVKYLPFPLPPTCAICRAGLGACGHLGLFLWPRDQVCTHSASPSCWFSPAVFTVSCFFFTGPGGLQEPPVLGNGLITCGSTCGNWQAWESSGGQARKGWSRPRPPLGMGSSIGEPGGPLTTLKNPLGDLVQMQILGGLPQALGF